VCMAACSSVPSSSTRLSFSSFLICSLLLATFNRVNLVAALEPKAEKTEDRATLLQQEIQLLTENVEKLFSNFLVNTADSKQDEFGYLGEKNDEGERHGVGRFNGDNHDYHFGQWKKSHRHGLGKSSFEGNTFIGEFRFNHQHGKGLLVTADGDRYEGDWRVGEQEGFGIYYWAADGSRYTGQWHDSNPHGIGTWENEEIKHSGGWLNGERHGKAKVTNKKTGVVLFIGRYEHGKPVKNA